MSYDAVLFDNDGVLVTPPDRDVLERAARDAFTEAGVADPNPDHVAEIVTGVTPDLLHETCAAYDLDPETFWRTRDAAAARGQRHAVRAGKTAAYDDVDALADLDVPLGVVSSNQHETVEFLLREFDLLDAFGTYYGRRPTIEDVRRKKPAPYFLERALADLGVDGDALFVGDSESDVVAAHNAGLDSAFVWRPHREGYDLGAEPTYELSGLADLAALV